MAEYNLEGILISVLVLGALFATLLMYYDDLTTNYPVNNYYEANLSEYQDNFNTISENAQDFQEGLEGLGSGNIQDIWGGLVQGLKGLFGIFTSSFTGIGRIFSQSIGLFDLGSVGPVWVGTALVGVLLVFIVGIWSAKIK